ncbi:hypothetical protein RHS01_00498 [Rhizoctonia solani]|uniref:BZIP domain-containing protein n=1 Tax=Rhizoctonia solani TaxID=456999 RepID=A0A8H7M5Y9_9AGAM|nr:hypothetical protein RHS01_00498 [Rhizoctonia solani]
MADMSPTRRRRPSKDTDSLSQDGTPQPASSAARRNEDDEARRDFLERNKLAARRHRERRKDKSSTRSDIWPRLSLSPLQALHTRPVRIRRMATAAAALDARFPTAGTPPAPSQPGEPRIPPGAARARLQALSEVYARAVRSCDDPIPIHCDARFRDLLAGAEDAAAPSAHSSSNAKSSARHALTHPLDHLPPHELVLACFVCFVSLRTLAFELRRTPSARSPFTTPTFVSHSSAHKSDAMEPKSSKEGRGLLYRMTCAPRPITVSTLPYPSSYSALERALLSLPGAYIHPSPPSRIWNDDV